MLHERFFSLLLDVIDTSIFTIDENGLITSFNRAAQNTTGYSAEEVLGKKCSEIFRTDLCDRGCPLFKTMSSGLPVIDHRVRIQVKDGRTLPVSVTTAALKTPEGELLGGVEVINDLSSLENLMRQLDDKHCFEDIVSKNAKLHQIFAILPLVARSDSTVLLQGESGTGKELVAKAIHHQGPRKDKPFVAVSCAAIPETLIESELFGYAKGAFTDAKQDRLGRIAQADGGTVFLDEVGDLPHKIQVKLLRFLQERVYEPLGATLSTRADVRIIAATHRNLVEMVAQGNFRQDLFFRLNVMQIELPPLRERTEDIPLLVQHFIQRFRKITGVRIERIEDEALRILMGYDFPGNVRELENIIERAFILCSGPTIKREHIPNSVVALSHIGNNQGDAASKTTKYSPVVQAEQDLIQETLRKYLGNRTRAARALGIHRSTLIRKLKRYGLAC